MSLSVHRADLFDMAEMSGAISRLTWAVAREMWAGGETFAVRDGDDLVALVGLYPLGDETAEAWFNIRPVSRGTLLFLVRQMRLTLQACAYRDIVTVCASNAGKRIARAAGFKPYAITQNGEVWKYDNSIRRRRQGGEAPETAARGAAAPKPR